MSIIATPIHNGHQYEFNGFTVAVTSDQRFFTIYDSFGEPCGSITRPAIIGGNKFWESHLCNGQVCTMSAIGPRSAFRSFIIGYGQ